MKDLTRWTSERINATSSSVVEVTLERINGLGSGLETTLQLGITSVFPSARFVPAKIRVLVILANYET